MKFKVHTSAFKLLTVHLIIFLQVIAILDKLKAEKKTAKGQDEEQVEASDHPQDDGDWEGEDPDGDIIYVE